MTNSDYKRLFVRERLLCSQCHFEKSLPKKRIVEITVRWRRNHLYDPALGENAGPRRKPFLQIPQLTNLPVDYYLDLIVQ